MAAQSFDYPDQALEKIAEIFRAFSEPVRLKIIRELHEGPKNVTQIHQRVGGSQANVSKHLKRLRNEGILKRQKEGVESIYEIARPEVDEICERVCDYFEKRLESEYKRNKS